MTTPNAPNVKRYNFCNFEKSGPEMQQAPEGEWVFYADLHAAEARATAAEARCKVLEEALTPSGDTKAAYIGEFSWAEPSDDHWGAATRTVPWDTVKDIMAAILSRANATLSRKDTQ